MEIVPLIPRHSHDYKGIKTGNRVVVGVNPQRVSGKALL
jgi:hypothetical protein